MDFAVWTHNDEATVCLSGELDIALEPDVDVAMHRALRQRPWVLSVDLRDVTFLDPSGLRALMRGWIHARGQHTTFELGIGRPSIERLFDIVSLRTTLAGHADPTERTA